MMLYPSFDEIRQLRDTVMAVRADTRKPLLPICCDILADMETPVSAYCKIASGPYSFLLESVVGGEHIARYSFIGIDPYLVMKHDGNTATLYRTVSDWAEYMRVLAISQDIQLHLRLAPNLPEEPDAKTGTGASGIASNRTLIQFE